MKKIFFTLLSIFIFNYSFSQNIDATSEAFFMSMSNPNGSDIVADGSPYIDENFMPVKLDAFKNTIFTGRFNAYNGQMEIVPSPGKSAIALNINQNSYVVEFIGQNKVYQTYNFEDSNGLSGKSFFVNVAVGKVSLLKKEQIKFFDKEAAISSYQKDKPAKFVKQDDTYFIKLEGENTVAKELPKKDKDIANIFPEHSKTILAYIKSEKLKTKKEEDLIKLVKFMSTL